MVIEPKINKEELQSFLSDAYNLEITEMIFIPRGECSWGYKIVTPDNLYFVKIYATLDVTEEAFQLTYDLYQKCGIKHIIHPLKTNAGEVRTVFQNYNLAIFNFVEGIVSAETTLNDDQFEQLGELIGQIHMSTKILNPLTRKETFEFKNDDYDRVMSSLSEGSEDSLVNEMKHLIQKHITRITQEYDELKALQKEISALEIPFVNCHGDPTPSNIMLTPQGEVYLIDWDDPIYAPKEKDLVFLHHRNPAVMTGYAQETGISDLNQTLLRFYEHKWNIEEIGGYGSLIMDSIHDDQKQRNYHMDGLKLTLNDMGISL